GGKPRYLSPEHRCIAAPRSEGTRPDHQRAAPTRSRRTGLVPLPAGASTTNRRDRPLRAIGGYIPRPLPAPLDQNGCGSGGDLVLTFSDGFKLPYGPYRRSP